MQYKHLFGLRNWWSLGTLNTINKGNENHVQHCGIILYVFMFYFIVQLMVNACYKIPGVFIGCPFWFDKERMQRLHREKRQHAVRTWRQGICLWIKMYALSTAYDNDEVAASRTIHIKLSTQRQGSYIHQQHLQNRFAMGTQMTRHIFGTTQRWIYDLFYPTLINRTQYKMSFAGQMTCSMLISYLYYFCQHLKNYDGFLFFSVVV